MKKETAVIVIATFVLFKVSGCEQQKVGIQAELLSLEEVTRACLTLDACSGGEGTELVYCMQGYHFSTSWQWALAAQNAYITCVGEAVDCEELDNCTGGECSISDTPFCDGNTAVYCSNGFTVRMDCREKDQICREIPGGVNCVDGTCEEHQEGLIWCEGDVQFSCHDGHLIKSDCNNLYKNGTCKEIDGRAVCTSSITCEEGEYLPHCDGDFIVFCREGEIMRQNCATEVDCMHCLTYPSTCAESESGAECRTMGISCEDLENNSCECMGNVYRLCHKGALVEIDCAEFGAECVEDGSYGNPSCTCRLGG